jgi:hypothetical protein
MGDFLHAFVLTDPALCSDMTHHVSRELPKWRRPMGRKKITGKSDPTDEPIPPPPRLALSILEFCDAHGISEGFYYKLKKQRKGPREMKVGTRTLITFEAAADWRREREAASVAEAKVKAAISARLIKEANV